MTDVHGPCDARFAALKAAFLENFSEGLEIGASLAATWRGKPVVDLWAGFANRRRTVPWAEDTIACLYSSAKIPTVICALMAVDRGLLDLDQTVAHYWPEFGAHGKEQITVREALTHRALVPGFDPPHPYGIQRDWDAMTAAIADEKPWFERGTQCYHPLTFGHLIGELIRRSTGTPFQDFFLSELADPLGVDFHIGIRDRDTFARLAQLDYPSPPELEPGTLMARVIGSFNEQPVGVDLQADWGHMSQPMPGSNGAGNARSLARIGSVMAMRGTLDGIRYLSPEIVDEAVREQNHTECPLMGDIHMGLGLGLDGDFFPAPTPTSFHWGGWGGSWCVMDAEYQLSVAYVMNRCANPEEEDVRRVRLWAAIREAAAHLDPELSA